MARPQCPWCFENVTEAKDGQGTYCILCHHRIDCPREHCTCAVCITGPIMPPMPDAGELPGVPAILDSAPLDVPDVPDARDIPPFPGVPVLSFGKGEARGGRAILFECPQCEDGAEVREFVYPNCVVLEFSRSDDADLWWRVVIPAHISGRWTHTQGSADVDDDDEDDDEDDEV